MGEPSVDNRSSMEKGPSTHIHDAKIKIFEDFKTFSELYALYEAEMQMNVHRFLFFGHGKAQVQANIEGDKHTPNGATASDTGSGIGLIELPMERNEPAVLNDPFSICASLELLPRHEKEKLEHMLRKFPGFEVLKPDKDLYSKTIVSDKHMPNGAFASEGGTLWWIGAEAFASEGGTLGWIGTEAFASEGGTLGWIGTDLPQHGKLKKGIHHHTINIPDPAEEDFRWGRFPNEVRGQNRGTVAILCTGVSAQTILGLLAGPGATSLPEPIFYCAAAANAIAFVSSCLALLLLKKKPRAAGILESVGFASAIATFLLMMRAFMP